MKRTVSCMIPFLMLLTAACGGDHAEESPGADACEHMIEGPSAAITAAALDATADIPVVDEEHTRFDITLADANGVNGGAVDLAIAEAGEHILFLSAGVSMTVVDSAGNGVTAEAMASDVPECAEVAASYTFDLGVGTYTLRFESADEAMVQMVVIPVGEHGHE